MQYIADIIIIAIIVISTIAGIKKGLILSLIDFLGKIIAAVCATVLSSSISNYIFEGFVREGLYNRVYETLQTQSSNLAIVEMFESFPTFMVNYLEKNGVTENSLIASTVGSTQEISNVLVDTLAPSVILVINFFVIFILFFIFLIIIKAIGAVVDKTFELPILSEINDILGGVFGLCSALVIVFICVSVIDFAGNLLNPTSIELLEEALDKSILAGLIFEHNPFSWIFG